MIPKQIIYPLHYLTPFFRRNTEKYERDFRSGFQRQLGTPHESTPIGRARSGIYLLTKLIVSESRNEVLLSPYTIPDLMNMVIFAGGKPRFVDFEPRSTSISLASIADQITDRTALVVVTHYHVNQANFSELLNLCESKGVRVVEDCAISLGGTINGKSVGTQSTGGVYSLSSYKFLNYFWGGAIYCRESEMQSQVEQQVSGWKRLEGRDYRSQIIRTFKYDFATRSIPYRLITAPLLRMKQRRSGVAQVLHQPRIESVEMDSTLSSRPSAGALCEWSSKLDSVGEKLEHRRRVAKIYHQHFAELSVGTDVGQQLNTGCFVNYPIWVGEDRRDHIYKKLILQGIDVGLSLYPNSHEHEKFKDLPGKSSEVAKLVRSVLSLPCHPRVSESYAMRVVEKIRQVI